MRYPYSINHTTPPLILARVVKIMMMMKGMAMPCIISMNDGLSQKAVFVHGLVPSIAKV